ncbi:MAG: hypothetical protein J7L96_03300 [Bacteroidales bacterium]|nr:hypothetical protein [Bacteroidales bacterium]
MSGKITSTGAGLIISILLLALSLVACNPYKTIIHTGDDTNLSKKIVDQLSSAYPFTGHKAINWDSFQINLQQYLSTPHISDSSYLQIRELFYSLPDARCNISRARDKQLMESDIGAYCGFDVARDQTRQCIVVHVDSSSQAWQQGLRTGNKILGWNGKSVGETVQNINLRWGYHPAGEEFREILQDHFLTRGPDKSSAEIFYETSTGNTRGIRVHFSSAAIDYAPKYAGIPSGRREKNFKISDNKLGIWIIPAFTPSVMQDFRKNILPALSGLNGLIIDLRENSGGNDAIAASLAGYFISEEHLYESTLVKDSDTDTWTDLGHIHAEPAESTFTKPVIMLIGPLCTGTGEGFARIMQMEDHIRTLGIWNTKGSFSYPGGEISIPGEFNIYYPIGMSLDENGVILIESSGNYGGGVYPDIKIPASIDVLEELAAGYDILLEEAIAHLVR